VRAAAISRRIEVRGFLVETAENGERALEMLAQGRYDAVILDLAMPGMDGIETLKGIIASDPLAQVILLTGHGSVRAATDAMRHGAFDFLEKPADFDELMEKVRRAISKRLELELNKTQDEVADILRKKGW
jgi:DNA-binding NtrC family response regulator